MARDEEIYAHLATMKEILTMVHQDADHLRINHVLLPEQSEFLEDLQHTIAWVIQKGSTAFP